MESNSEDDTARDDEGAEKESGWDIKPRRTEDGEVPVTPAFNPKMDCARAGTPEYQDEDKSERENVPKMSHGVGTEGQAEVLEPKRDAPSVSPLSCADTCNPSISSLSSSCSSSAHHINFSSSSSSSSLCSSVVSLTPPLPPSVELSAVLTSTRLTLDVYQGGAAALPLLWGSIPGQLRGLQYLRLGSEDKPGLDEALDVLPHLTQLRSLAIRGNCLCDSRGEPLPGLLTTLPTSLSSLSHLVHLDLSFNQLSRLPPCLFSLPVLSLLLLSHNQISTLPPEIAQLSSLTYLSLLGNKLLSLPPSLGQLKALQTLDVSHNLLQELPDEIGSLGELVKLELSHNKLKQLPESMGSLISLRELVIYSNDLRLIPCCLNQLPLLKIDTRDNPLGKPPTPPPPPPTPDTLGTKIPELHIAFNQHSFSVSSGGCHVFLPGGAELVFPPGCLAKTTRLRWAERRPDRKFVFLEEHDILLSRPLELCPHGIQFQKPVDVCVPYHRRRKGEVVVRSFDGEFWSTLPTDLRRGSDSHSSRPGGRPARVVQVSESELQSVCGDPQAKASPLLCLSQTPSLHFLQPVKVQIPLPPGVTGHTADLSRLHLLHGDPAAQTWTDITSQVSLNVTQLYVIFYITHFSWYWLWYTTQRCVSGVVRKVYQRLKQFKVQFLVLQRKADPSQVLLQCLPSNKMESRVQTLSEQYDGPQPSDLCDLLEGEQFYAGFERGLDISTDRPDCVGGRLCFVFYSSLKNLKEVYICPAQDRTGPVRGQVSFYRGEIPSNLPEEVARKRKGLDSQWLATLPLKLPALNADNSFNTEELRYPPLNLGDPESGYLTEANLLSLSLQIGLEWRVIGINLGLNYQELDRIQYKNKDNLGALVLDMLFQWAQGQRSVGPGSVSRLMDAMTESGRKDLAEEIENIVNIGTRKYSESLRRVGLEAESAPPGEGQQ
ncbi:unnamed protein product [Menidia menidia]|uniref:(Atlantic silverside) hypothetical protein n=1 Tax=Menidia menidia TaxID=238744 RepID=A0A8S4BID1_9TELE|nr:unnamed protein product [Menidia menidia]